ncbi:MAG: hypothetical protein VKQ33_12120 [Candidatus Sericytochromatia bacterium]|nr:hypothetical protein [Candidatus Sericytochromatia bacterium]
MRAILALSALAVAALVAQPAVASTSPVADLQPGQTLAVGLSGVSWDHAWTGSSIGLELRNTAPLPGSGSRFLAGARGTLGVVAIDRLRVAAVGGVQLDPGLPGGRAYLLPDLGLGASYGFTLWQWSFALRFNVTLTLDQGQGGGGTVPLAEGSMPYPIPTGNLFQRLTLGPNTMLGVAFAPSDRYELTLGGGTLVGLRVRY